MQTFGDEEFNVFATRFSRRLETASLAETWVAAVQIRFDAMRVTTASGTGKPAPGASDEDFADAMRASDTARQELERDLVAIANVAVYLVTNNEPSQDIRAMTDQRAKAASAQTTGIDLANLGSPARPRAIRVWREAIALLRSDTERRAENWTLDEPAAWLCAANRAILRASQAPRRHQPPRPAAAVAAPDELFHWFGLAPMQAHAGPTRLPYALVPSQMALWWVHEVARFGAPAPETAVEWAIWLGTVLLPATRRIAASADPRIGVDRFANACACADALSRATTGAEVRRASADLLLAGAARTRRGRRELVLLSFKMLDSAPRPTHPLIARSLAELRDEVARDLVARVCGVALRDRDAIVAFFHGLFASRAVRPIPPPLPTDGDADLLVCEERRWRRAI